MGGSISIDGAQKGTFTFDELESKVNGTYNRGELRLDGSGKLHRMNNHVWGIAKFWNDKTSSVQQNIDVRNAVFESIRNRFSANAGVKDHLAVAREFLLGCKNFAQPLSREEVRKIISQLKSIEARPLKQRQLAELEGKGAGLEETRRRLDAEDDKMQEDYESKDRDPERYAKLVEIDRQVAMVKADEAALRKKYPKFDELDRAAREWKSSPEVNGFKRDPAYLKLLAERSRLKTLKDDAGITDDRAGGTVGYFESRRKYNEYKVAEKAVTDNNAQQESLRSEIGALDNEITSAEEFRQRLAEARANAVAPGRRTVNEGIEGQTLRKDDLKLARNALLEKQVNADRTRFKIQAYVIKDLHGPYESALLAQLSEHAGNVLEQARAIRDAYPKFIDGVVANLEKDIERGFEAGRPCVGFLKKNRGEIESALAASLEKLSDMKGRAADYRRMLADAADRLDAVRQRAPSGDENGEVAIGFLVQELRKLSQESPVLKPLPRFANQNPVGEAVMGVTVKDFAKTVDDEISRSKEDPLPDEEIVFSLDEKSSDSDFLAAGRVAAEKLSSLLKSSVEQLDSLIDVSGMDSLVEDVGIRGGKTFDDFVSGLCELIRRSDRQSASDKVRQRLFDLVSVAADRFNRLVKPESVQARKIARSFGVRARSSVTGSEGIPSPGTDAEKIARIKEALAEALAEARQKLGKRYDLSSDEILLNVREDTFDHFVPDLEQRLRGMGNTLCQALADEAEGLAFVFDSLD